MFVWDHQEAAQPLCLLRLWALCLTVPVTTGFCSGAACWWELNWDCQMVPVSYGPVSNGAKIADAVCFLGRIWNSAKCAMFHWLFPTFSSLDETISLFFPNFFCCWGTVQHGCAGEELQHQVKGTSGLSADVCPRKEGAHGTGMGPGRPNIGMLLQCCYRLLCDHQQLWKQPLFPVLCFLNRLLCKTIAEFDSQKCSEALGVKYYDKRRHSSSLLHRTF